MPKAHLVFEKELPRGSFLVYKERPELDLFRVKQTHSDIVLPVLPNQNCADDQMCEADAMVSSAKKPMAILTADCLPILILGKEAHAFVHAGWRGLHNEILKQELIKKISPFYAFIGPHISAQNYEVQPDFKKNFSQPEAFIEKDGKLFFDLSFVARSQLLATYPGIKIEESGKCTFADHNFQSYRRNATTKRNWNVYIP